MDPVIATVVIGRPREEVFDYLADIDAAVEHFAKDEPLRIVGHSMGAAAALLYLGARPGRVTHLTLIDALPITVGSADVQPRVTRYLEDLRALSKRERRPVRRCARTARRGAVSSSVARSG